MPDESLVFNGIRAADGEPAFPPVTAREVAAQALADRRHTFVPAPGEPLGPVREEERGDLSKAGWGVVFASDEPQTKGILEALQPLLELRKGRAGKLFRILQGEIGHRAGEDHMRFLERFGLGAQGPDPEKLPANLLLVGSPARIPFAFQSLLGQWYNVGRLDFATPDAYGRYAASVAEHEEALGDEPCRVSFFGSRHQGDADKAPRLAAEHLLVPLKSEMEKDREAFDIRRDFTLEYRTGKDATKAALRGLLGGGTTPDLLLAAAHGTVFRRGDPEQQARQGGLVCSDWSGKGPPGTSAYSSADVGAADDVRGLIAFFFACYGGGTPLYDQFVRQEYVSGLPIAGEPFVAGLPKALLGLKNGPLAVVGHVERVWSLSFSRGPHASQTGLFHAFLRDLIEGEPVGQALRSFAQYFGSCASHLTERLNALTREQGRLGPKPHSPSAKEADELAELWTVTNDAKGYLLLGDPAVRLRKPVHRR